MVEVTEARITQTDLISREAAIAVLKSEFYEQCPKSSVQRILFANAIQAIANMPSAVTVTGSPTLTITYADEKP